MIYYTSSSGTIIGGTSGSDLTGITHLPSSADYAIYIDDETVSAANPNNEPGTYSMTNVVAGPVYSVPTATGTLVFTEASAAEQLANAQTAQIANINAGYNATIAAGFTSNATGTAVVYGWQIQDQLDLQLVQSAINQSIDTFPVAYGSMDGTIVSITSQTMLTQLQTDANNFAWAQKTQLRSLIAQVNAQTSVPSTPVTWTPGSYTPQPAPTTS